MIKKIINIDKYNDVNIDHVMNKNTNKMIRTYDCTYAKDILGYVAKTPIDEALSNTIEWYKKNINHS